MRPVDLLGDAFGPRTDAPGDVGFDGGALKHMPHHSLAVGLFQFSLVGIGDNVLGAHGAISFRLIIEAPRLYHRDLAPKKAHARASHPRRKSLFALLLWRPQVQ